MSKNEKSTFVMLGATNHSEKEREKDDFYATDPHALEIFLDKLKKDKFELHKNIWECACGKRSFERNFAKKRIRSL